MDRRLQIRDFYEGKLSGQQARELLDWLHSPEGEAFLSTEIDQIWEERVHDLEYSTQELWQKIKTNRTSNPLPELMKPTVTGSAVRRNKYLPMWLKVACSIVLVGLALWFYLPSLRLTQPVEQSGPVALRMITKYNPPGQKTKVHLADGSIVYLNSDSKIEYPADFLTNRRIMLEGEAFFTVSKDTLNPFSVVARGITTTAIGTSFNVSTFTRDDKVKVTLVSGKVKLNQSGEDKQLILNPGEQSILSGSDREYRKNQVDIRKSILWIDGILVFENAPIEDVIDILERWYGVNIEIKGKITPSLCSGTFQNNEMLSNVLKVLGPSVGFDYALKGKQVTIQF